MTRLRVALAQLNYLVGDIDGNVAKIIAAAERARDALQADVAVFTELAVSGYPPEDLLLRADFIRACRDGLERIRRQVGGIDLIVGFPERHDGRLYNSAAVLRDGEIRLIYRKHCLPNYGVFDEKRYFHPGQEPGLCLIRGVPVGLSICEDIWHPGPVEASVRAGSRLIVNLNASPFHVRKIAEREAAVHARIAATGVPVVYVNQIGGQDELVFDGASFVMDREGRVVRRLPEFEEALEVAEFRWEGERVVPEGGLVTPVAEEIPSIRRAIVLAIRDYTRKNGFNGAVLGLSGGIDSSVVLCLAVEALGAENVEAVMMPSRFTSEISLADAKALAANLGVNYRVIPIEPAFQAFLQMLEQEFAGRPWDVTEENIQARCRGVTLMAISNKFGRLVLSTGNKSEMSVGYATLYGDMAGGYAPIKDVMKLKVYALAEHLNAEGEIIPGRVLVRPPSAELAPDQKDEDSLPPYAVLDPILEMYVEQDLSVEEIVAAGFDEAVVRRVVSLVERNEYKRRQAPPGVRITPRAFGRERRYPITNGFRSG
ncbi:NAD+ synthase (glutamine-hydrolysing) [Methylomarinovum caldicuralii]|uniref:Glutamine-dependent NAD(+) synthetase n=1 Tax=Methylomarinovum caldicuralii TaxID=438856 RepID=A0AAU9C1T7_9GAMM|nr:NAD+ synthase [Methylomarinovum caldicuralii]BCX82690.1 NAD+ synthase (glutamine-hydrolysing) [Methylomarinovum caldicuralii]